VPADVDIARDECSHDLRRRVRSRQIPESG
jgi:hypothetical protein